MNFESAFKALHEGNGVYRKSLACDKEGCTFYVMMIRSDTWKRLILVQQGENGKCTYQPFTPEDEDILADDWEIVMKVQPLSEIGEKISIKPRKPKTDLGPLKSAREHLSEAKAQLFNYANASYKDVGFCPTSILRSLINVLDAEYIISRSTN